MQSKKLKLAAMITMITVSPLQKVMANPDQDALNQRIKNLEAQLQSLQQVVKKQSVGYEELTAVVSQQKHHVPGKKTSGTQYSFGGFIKANAMWSDYSGGERANAGIGDEILVPSVIPIGGTDGAPRFDTHVKTSRLWFKTVTPSQYGNIKTHFEVDNLTAEGDERISNSSGIRIRHAYFSWDYADSSSLLFGETWSTLMNVKALPESVDFIGPTSGVIFNRQVQVRWTKQLANNRSFNLAIENPSTSLFDGGFGLAGNNFDDNQLPDVIAKYNQISGNLDFSVAAIVREIAFDDGVNNDDKFGFGLSLSGKYTFHNGNDLRFQLSHGNFGRYLALQAFRDAAVELDGSIDLIEQTGGYVAYRHFWNKKLRSTVLYAMSVADNPVSIGDTNNETVSNYSINLYYSPVEKLSLGMEYLFAERELENGADGDLSRLQFTSKYVF